MSASIEFGAEVRWRPDRPRFSAGRLLLAWLVVALAILVAGRIVPGFAIESFGTALTVALVLSLLNTFVSPLLAAARLPLPLVSGFVLMLVANAYLLLLAEEISAGAHEVESFSAALAASVVIAATVVVLEVLLGVNDDVAFDARVTRRIARRQGEIETTDLPGIVFLEIDGLALPVLQRAMSDGSAPNMASWLASGTHRLVEWETDLSSQTGASQAGILLGSNADIPAFRWVEKETGRVRSCSAPADCATLEREHATGQGLLVGGGASRGNLLSGEADETILTVSRMASEMRANPGYRTFFSSSYNVTRTLVLFAWEVILEWVAALRARRRNVQPRGHRGGLYPFMRAAMCVVIRDVIAFGVLSDMMRGRPAIYATFSSYDEVAHHSGLQRPDTLEALRKVDQVFGRIARARRFAPRPYELVVLSDHGQTQGATFLQRNGLSLEALVRDSLDEDVAVVGAGGGDETNAMVGHALDEATGRSAKSAERAELHSEPADGAVVLGSGNLGLVYFMDEPRRLTLEEIDGRHPELLGTLRTHPHIGWVLVHSQQHGPLALGANGTHYLADGRIEGEDPLAPFSPNAPAHLLRTDGFRNAPDLLVGSFYDPMLEEGCAFEELISFHGGLGGPQTRPFVLHPVDLPLPSEPIIGAEAVHRLLQSWRTRLQGEPASTPEVSGPAAVPPVRRPRGVTIAAVVIAFQALVVSAAGVASIAEAGRAAEIGLAAALLCLGLLEFVVAASLWIGRRWARLLVTAVEVVTIVGGVQQTLSQTGSGFWGGLVSISSAVVVLMLLYAGSADAYFTGGGGSAPPPSRRRSA